MIGASAGGIDAVSSVIRSLPEDFPAAIFIVIHTSPEGPGLLSNILDRIGPLPATTVQANERIVSGHIYVAPPDFHIVLGDGRVRLSHGPREHRFRPAVDPLFRSAAAAYGPRVIGVVLSGHMADGTHGLLAIKNCGGVAIVQDPEQAPASSMPLSALRAVKVDYVLPTADIGPTLEELIIMPAHEPARRSRTKSKSKKVETTPEAPEMDALETGAFNGPPSPLTCPDCGGALWEIKQGELVRYRCHVGHGFNEESLLAGQDGNIEETLWSALRALEESLELRRRMAARARAHGLDAILRGVERDIADLERRADVLRDLLLEIPKARQRTPPAKDRAKQRTA